MEHKGIIFTPPYVPHGVPILHNGKELVLKPDEEEIANMWADLTESDFVLRPEVWKNFWNDFKKVLDPSYGIKSLDELDFKQLREFLVKWREEKKQRPREERKAEMEEK